MAYDALRRVASYGAALAPLCLSHFVVPPLSTLSDKPEQPPFYFAPLVSVMQFSPAKKDIAEAYKYMALLSKRTEKYNYEQVNYRGIAHMFLHKDYDHIESNILIISIFGYFPYKYLGLVRFYALFFSGGLYAALNNEIFASNILQAMQSRLEPESLPENLTVTDTLLGTLRYTLNSVVDYLNIGQFKVSIGSSAGGYALTGSSIFVLMPFSLLRNEAIALFADGSKQVNFTAFLEPLITVARLGSVLFLASLSYKLHSSLLDGANKNIAMNKDIFARMQQTEQVDDVAHLNGLHFGIAVGLSILLRRRFWTSSHW